MSGLVRSGSAVAALLTLHTALNLRFLRRPQAHRDPRPFVSVLLPARNEAARIAPCIRAVLASRDVDLELIVLDDGSADGTAEVALRAARHDPRVRLVEGAALPPGWLGKPHACAQLATLARGDVLVFLDADVLLASDGLAATVDLLADGLDVVCPYPRQLADGFLPQLVQPLLQWSWLTFLPLRLAERSPRPSLVAANGQLLACTADAYRRSGGHAAVRDAVLEDLALARAAKRAGLRVAIADGTELATCRMYASSAELCDGYAKSLWAAFGSPAGAVAVVALLAWCYVLPPLAAVGALVARRPGGAGVPALGYAAGVLGRVLVARRTGGRPADALAHPLSILALGWLVALSWWRKAAGGLQWRGRALP